MYARSCEDTRRRSEAGAALVALLAATTVALILMGAAAQEWHAIVQREKEEEAIYRGAYIARALQRYSQERGGSFPTWQQFEEWAKQRGKVRKSALVNPLDKDGKWRVVLQNGIVPEDQALPCGRRAQVQQGGGELVGPVVGVTSKTKHGSYMTLCGRTQYDEWAFLAIPAGQPGVPQPGGGAPPPAGQPGVPGAPGGAPLPSYQDYKTQWVGYTPPGMLSQRGSADKGYRRRQNWPAGGEQAPSRVSREAAPEGESSPETETAPDPAPVE